MPARSLVLGLDGLDMDVLESIGPERLPNLFRERGRGSYSRLRSVLPPATLPNWTTFLTGVDPGVHGVFDFTTRIGTKVSFTGGTVREAPTLAARLDRIGKACLVVGFPGTYPPERLEHGIFISGWDSPVAFEADATFVEPRALYGELVARFGAMRFDDVNEIEADRAGFHDVLPELLAARIERKVELAKHLMRERTFDMAAIYFGESDTASHHLWAHHDADSPRHPSASSSAARNGLVRVYEALDAAVGEMLAAAGPNVELTVVSDHGSGGSSDKVLYLNRALAEAGLLRFRGGGAGGASLSSGLKDLGMRTVPARLRDAAFGVAGRALPGWVESRARFAGIDFPRTRVFSDELNYFPALHVNLEGREPHGCVPAAALPALRLELERFAEDLRDPWSGDRVIERVLPREELYSGPLLHRAPDFLLELRLTEGYSYNLLPTGSAPAKSGTFRKLTAREHLGRKGRSLAGSHRARGVWIASGPRVRARGEVDARIADASATTLARMDVAVPMDLAGRVIREMLTRSRAASSELPAMRTGSPQVADADLARTEARLRTLGYVD
jgi:predicted AlkP superfamily phosphohydrolase/phosphomutase